MKTIVITGANTGIGKEAALQLAQKGERVLMINRASAKSTAALAEIKQRSGSDEVYLFTADLAEPAQVRAVAAQIQAQFPVLDVLVNNAGVFKTKREENNAGVELNVAVNFLAPYLLSNLLLENLAASGDGRIVNVVSELYKQGDITDLFGNGKYKSQAAYANSKMACVYWSKQFADQVAAQGVTVTTLHPGVLATDVFRDYPRFFARFLNLFLEKPEKGGERIVYLAIDPAVTGVSGDYFMKKEQQDVVLPAGGVVDELTQKAAQLTT